MDPGDDLVVIQSDRCVLAQQESIALPEGHSHRDLDLTRGVVEDRATDRSGAPLAGQVPHVNPSLPPDAPLRNAYSAHRVHTGVDGRYRLSGLPEGTPFRIQIHGRGWQGRDSELITLDEGATSVTAEDLIPGEYALE